MHEKQKAKKTWTGLALWQTRKRSQLKKKWDSQLKKKKTNKRKMEKNEKQFIKKSYNRPIPTF